MMYRHHNTTVHQIYQILSYLYICILTLWCILSSLCNGGLLQLSMKLVPGLRKTTFCKLSKTNLLRRYPEANSKPQQNCASGPGRCHFPVASANIYCESAPLQGNRLEANLSLISLQSAIPPLAKSLILMKEKNSIPLRHIRRVRGTLSLSHAWLLLTSQTTPCSFPVAFSEVVCHLPPS